ncbi:MAG: divergent PAP2 family protein [archaeon]
MVEWRIFTAVFLTVALIQIVKSFWSASKKEKVGLKSVWVDGGVVSAHSGAVAALCLSILLVEGLSNLFFVCLIFSIIVIRDAVGVRKIARENAKILNRKFRLKREVNEGHSFMEILRGVVVGLVVAFLVIGA